MMSKSKFRITPKEEESGLKKTLVSYIMFYLYEEYMSFLNYSNHLLKSIERMLIP